MRPLTYLAVDPPATLPRQGNSGLRVDLLTILAPTGATVGGYKQYTLPNYVQILGFLQKIVVTNEGGDSPAGNPITVDGAKDILTEMTTTQNNLGLSAIYGAFRRNLMSAYGQFCSYCELPVGSSGLAVEHLLAKSVFPDIACSPGNLLLACPMCNSFKGTAPTPTGDDAYDWPVDWANSEPAIPNPPVTWDQYGQIKNVLYNAYMWPLYQAAYKNFNRALMYQEAAGGAFQKAAGSFDFAGVSIVSTAGGVIKAVLPEVAPGPVSFTVQVWVTSGMADFIGPDSVLTSDPTFPAPPAGVDPNSKQMVPAYTDTNGQGMLNLNNDDASQSYTDRRMYNRTLAWFAALGALDRLNDAMEIGEPAYNLVMQEVASSATTSGFFSIWFAVFNANAPTAPGDFGPVANPPPDDPGNIPDATVDFVNGTVKHAYPPPPPPPPAPPAGVGFPGTNVINTIPAPPAPPEEE